MKTKSLYAVKFIISFVLLTPAISAASDGSQVPPNGTCDQVIAGNLQDYDWFNGDKPGADGVLIGQVKISQPTPEGTTAIKSMFVLNNKAASRVIAPAVIQKLAEAQIKAQTSPTKRFAGLALQDEKNAVGVSTIREIALGDENSSLSNSSATYNEMFSEALTDLKRKGATGYLKVIIITGDETVHNEPVNDWAIHAIKRIGAQLFPDEFQLPVQAFKATKTNANGKPETIYFFWKH